MNGFAKLAALGAALLLPLTATAAANQRVTLLFTGDNGGEVSPCG